jgi:spore coat polysaccharide biosynthesis protein SpsF (cytidylyltransferase family)
MGSSRLPGKVLMDIGGRPALRHVLDRCHAIKGADIVTCAIPDEAASEPLERIADECGAVTFRGSETDVLSRYLGAARSVKADVVMRVTSDCPLIDPEICADVLSLRANSNADYACNNTPRTFPHGLDCEAFTFAALERAADEANEPGDHEHVTPWLRRAATIRRENLSSNNPALAGHRWTLDYPEDLAFFRALSDRCPDFASARMRDILNVLDRYPEIAFVNRQRHPG